MAGTYGFWPSLQLEVCINREGLIEAWVVYVSGFKPRSRGESLQLLLLPYEPTYITLTLPAIHRLSLSNSVFLFPSSPSFSCHG